MSENSETPQLAQIGMTITCKMDNLVLLVVFRRSSYSSSILSSTSRSKDQFNWDHCQIQCRPEVTSMHAGNRCWQIMTSRPRGTVSPQTRRTRKIQRKAFLFGYSPSQTIWRTWRRMCSHIPLKEWTQIRKVKLQKWRDKNGSIVFMLTSATTKRDPFCERKRMVTWQQQSTKSSTKDVNFGTITDTLSWYKFSPLSGIRVKPKLHRRRRRVFESSYSSR